MEDLIYILLGLIWLFVTFYTQYRKKKQRELQSSKSTGTEQTPKKKSLLEELFSENEMFKEKKDHSFPSLDYDHVESYIEEEEPEPIQTFKDEYEKKGISSVETYENKYYTEGDHRSFNDLVAKAQTGRVELYQEVQSAINKKKKAPIIFDLRKALIYQAILERPYE